jgi:glycosyltransferase involved in cell wall biosynthesis
MKPIFSLCVPTRNHVLYIERLLGTLKENTNNPDRIEVLFAYDEDDIITEAYLQHCKNRFPFSIRIFSREQSDFFNRDYYNWLADKAMGEFVWVIGDDLLFIKEDWDVFLIQKINEYLSTHQTRIIYINIKDNTPPPAENLPRYANFPLISKEAIRVVGFFMPPEIPSWSGDYLVYLIYCGAKTNRILEMEEELLHHVSPYTGMVVEPKATNRHRTLYNKYNVKELVPIWIEYTLPTLIGKLDNYLQSYRRKNNELISLL